MNSYEVLVRTFIGIGGMVFLVLFFMSLVGDVMITGWTLSVILLFCGVSLIRMAIPKD